MTHTYATAATQYVQACGWRIASQAGQLVFGTDRGNALGVTTKRGRSRCSGTLRATSWTPIVSCGLDGLVFRPAPPA